MQTKRKIIIAGAGLGGLMTALCLYAAGFFVEVFESAQEKTARGWFAYFAACF